LSKNIGHDRSKFNIGSWVAAKIYSDVKGNACSCGGRFAFYQELKRRDKKSIFIPVCTMCKEPPARFRIRAKLADERGQKKYVFVRKTLGGQYLEDVEVVLDVFKRVETDEKLGQFRYTQYDKRSVKDRDLFKNVVAAYLVLQEKRTDLSPYSLDSKRKYSKLLLEHFAEYSIHDIEAHHIEDYKITLKSHTNQAMCLGTMKTILNWAAERYKLARVPKFEVPSSKKRKSVPDLAVAEDQILPAIENEIHREAIRMLKDYGFRPSEVRAIQYEQIDLINDRIVIDRHFSKTTLLMGRKSAAEGEDTATLDRPLTPELRAFIKSRAWPLDKKQFLFTNKLGKPLGVKDLSQTWRETLKKLKLPHVEMYGLRGAKGTEVIKEHGIHKGMQFLGHTDIKTTMKYDHSGRNVDDLFG
jgi:integrase